MQTSHRYVLTHLIATTVALSVGIAVAAAVMILAVGALLAS